MVFLFNWEQGVVLAQNGVVVGKERGGTMDFCCAGGGAGPPGPTAPLLRPWSRNI